MCDCECVREMYNCDILNTAVDVDRYCRSLHSIYFLSSVFVCFSCRQFSLFFFPLILHLLVCFPIVFADLIFFFFEGFFYSFSFGLHLTRSNDTHSFAHSVAQINTHINRCVHPITNAHKGMKLDSLVANPNSLIHTRHAIGTRLRSMEFQAMPLEIKNLHFAVTCGFLPFYFPRHYEHSMKKIKQKGNMHFCLSFSLSLFRPLSGRHFIPDFFFL